MIHKPSLLREYCRKYQQIVALYSRERDRIIADRSFAALLKLAPTLDGEQKRAVRQALSADEQALFGLIFRSNLSAASRDRLKQASSALLASVLDAMAPSAWTAGSGIGDLGSENLANQFGGFSDR